jgi:hypothetical protein
MTRPCLGYRAILRRNNRRPTRPWVSGKPEAANGGGLGGKCEPMGRCGGLRDRQRSIRLGAWAAREPSGSCPAPLDRPREGRMGGRGHGRPGKWAARDMGGQGNGRPGKWADNQTGGGSGYGGWDTRWRPGASRLVRRRADHAALCHPPFCASNPFHAKGPLGATKGTIKGMGVWARTWVAAPMRQVDCGR